MVTALFVPSDITRQKSMPFLVVSLQVTQWSSHSVWFFPLEISVEAIVHRFFGHVGSSSEYRLRNNELFPPQGEVRLQWSVDYKTISLSNSRSADTISIVLQWHTPLVKSLQYTRTWHALSAVNSRHATLDFSPFYSLNSNKPHCASLLFLRISNLTSNTRNQRHVWKRTL